MNIQEDYVSFEIAKLLKEKGFPQEYDKYHSLVYNEEDYEDEYEVQRMVLETKLVKAGTLSSYPVGVPEPKCYCPSQAVVMKWLTVKHNIYYEILLLLGENVEKYGELQLGIYQLNSSGSYVWIDWIYADTYAELYENYIKYCLKNLI